MITDLQELRRETIEDLEKELLECEKRIKELEDDLFEEQSQLRRLKKTIQSMGS